MTLRILGLVVLAGLLLGQEVTLQAPLSTVMLAEGPVVAGDKRISAMISVPADAPGDLGVAAFVRARDGHWFQRRWTGALTPGRHALSLSFTASDLPQAEPLPVGWRSEDAVCSDQAGLVFWSAVPGKNTIIQVEHLVVAQTTVDRQPAALRDLEFSPLIADRRAHVACGQRWTVRVLPAPFPANPADPAAFTLDALISGPDGERSIPCAYVQPMRSSDRGDMQEVRPQDAGRFELRFRPAKPGIYRATLVARWADGRRVESALPELHASGPAVDTLVRVDPDDHRFFSVAGRCWWPVGLNLHSTFDKRSQEALSTRLTPARGALVYDALMPRCAAAGIDACEIWLSSWNLSLEWRGDWPGFRGLGRINQENAWRLDQVLDQAWSNGLRVNLVINNHGQASPKADREWKDNPWNVANGGPLTLPEELFSDPRALAGQHQLRRYLVARYADHPAVLGWKLWSEIDLTAGRGEPLVRWHEQAAAAWRSLDTYGHISTTHWSGSYAKADPVICALPGMGYLCIDAYRGAGRDGQWSSLADLLANSIADPERGLGRWSKPVLTTEYGSSNKAPIAMRHVDHRIAGWTSLVSGHAGAAMTWWWEWVDQNNLWQPYRALHTFIAEEDPRGRDAGSLPLTASASDVTLWCRAWGKPGRMLGYLLDPQWATRGGTPRPHSDATVTIGDAVAAGSITIEWWNADQGVVLIRNTIDHPGGPLRLTSPAWAGHLVFKMWRTAISLPSSE